MDDPLPPQDPPGGDVQDAIGSLLNGLSGQFVENRGQMGEGAGDFYVAGSPLSVALSDGGVSYSLATPGEDGHVQGVLVRVDFPGSNRVDPTGRHPAEHTTSRFAGADPGGWERGLRTYGKLVYTELYDGIDLSYQLVEGRLKYEFLVRPGADPGHISMRYQGIECMRLEGTSGDLLVETCIGTLRDSAPVSYQDLPGGRAVVDARYRIAAGDVVCMDMGAFDPRYPLVIDPVVAYSSYFGGDGWEQYMDMAVSPSGEVYVGGLTESPHFPTTPGAWDTQKGGTFDMFAVKFNASLSKLDYSTYIGGSESDYVGGVTVLEDGCLMIAGRSRSDDYPVTTGAYCTTRNGSFDVVVTLLNGTGDGLVYSTFVGGSGDDSGTRVCTDGTGCAYVLVDTKSNDFPVSSDAFDRDRSGSYDLAVFKLDATGSSLGYSTYLSGSDWDMGHDIDVDDEGMAYVTGYTRSLDFPVTQGAFDTTLDGQSDGFVCRFDANGTSLEYCTLIGGDGDDRMYGLEVDARDRALITGQSASDDFPTTAGAYDRTKDGSWDVVVARVSSDGSNLERSTFVGRSDWETGLSVAQFENGSVYVTGYINTGNDFPITPGGSTVQDTDSNNIIFFRMDRELLDLQFSSLYGSSDWDSGLSIGLDANESVYICGRTRGSAFPTTTNAYDRTYNGGQDVVVMRLEDFRPPRVLDDGTPSVATTGDPLTFTVNVSDNAGVDEVSVEYWFGSGGAQVDRDLALTGGTSTKGTWTATIDIPSDADADLTYRMSVTDKGLNRVDTDNRTVEVIDDDPPVVQDVHAGTPYTNKTLGIYCNVSDNLGVQGASVVHHFSTSAANVMNLSMKALDVDVDGNGEYELLLDVPLNQTGQLRFQVFVVDRYGNTFTSAQHERNVVDNIRPRFMDTTLSDPRFSGGTYHFEVEVWDNIDVERVRVVYWFGQNEYDNVIADMVRIGGTGDGRYNYAIDNTPDPFGKVGPMSFRFYLTDVSGLSVESAVISVPIVDVTPPWLIQDLSDTKATTGDPFDLEVTVGDDMGVLAVNVLIWFGDGTDDAENRSMVGSATADPTVWRFTLGGLGVPSGSVEPLLYVFIYQDTSGNQNMSEPVVVQVKDDDAPRVVDDQSGGTATTSDPYNFTILVTDNVGVDTVRVTYTIPGLEECTVELEKETFGAEGPWAFNATVDMPGGVTGRVSYVVEAVDGHGNEAAPLHGAVTLEDDDAPSIVLLDHPERTLRGTSIEVLATVTDNIAVDGVLMVVTCTGADPQEVVMVGVGPYEASFAVPRDTGDELSIRVTAVDAAGNTRVSEEVVVSLYNAPPVLAEGLVWNVTEGVESTLSLTPFITDANDPVEEVTVSCDHPGVIVNHQDLAFMYEGDGGEDLTVTVVLYDGEDSASYTLTLRAEGRLVEDEFKVPLLLVVVALCLTLVFIGMVLFMKRRRR